MDRKLLALLSLVAIAAPGLAQAYIGPGAGVSAIGAALALVGAVFFAIVGFIWYPVKRLLRSMRRKTEDTPQAPQAPGE